MYDSPYIIPKRDITDLPVRQIHETDTVQPLERPLDEVPAQLGERYLAPPRPPSSPLVAGKRAAERLASEAPLRLFPKGVAKSPLHNTITNRSVANLPVLSVAQGRAGRTGGNETRRGTGEEATGMAGGATWPTRDT